MPELAVLLRLPLVCPLNWFTSEYDNFRLPAFRPEPG